PWQPLPSPPLPHQPTEAFLHQPPTLVSSSSPLITRAPSFMLSAGSREEPPTAAMVEVGDDTPTESTPMLLMLHTRCWPSTRWLDALAGAATARLYTPGFRAQSLGILLWSLAGLGYSPQPGWLQPWLRRAEELVGDFRANNLTSVLCALSAWGELPVGSPAVALRATLLRLLPTMGARELQLTASALAQLCELPPSSPPVVSDVKGTEEPTLTNRRRDERTMGGRKLSPGRGRSSTNRHKDSRNSSGSAGGVVGLFVPLSQPSRVEEVQPVVGGDPHVVRSRVEGPVGSVMSRRPDRNDRNDQYDDGEDEGEVKEGNNGCDLGPGVRPPGQRQRLVMPRHRRLEPRIEQLLVQRAVQVSYNYSPRHMARMLRVLVLRLGCIRDFADLQALLLGNAMHLEAVVAEPLRRRRQRRHRRRRDDSAAGKDRENEDAVTPRTDHSAAAAAASGDVEVGWDRDLARRRELRELATVVLDAVRAVAPKGASLSDEEAAMLLPMRWWRAYLTALEASP
ncbi:hypothetical protein Vretimale_18874, partial [Volvox reticuliferus]